MEQDDRLEWLLEWLLAELPAQDRPDKPETYAERRALYRALVNIRPPRAVSAAFLATQDAFLQEEARRKGIVAPDAIPPCATDSRLSVWRGDITRLAVDAIVNAANSAMLGCFVPGHHCIDNAIHTAAGVQLREECHVLMSRQGCPEEPGQAKVTRGYNLPARSVMHTVGPQVTGLPTKTQQAQLAACYKACLEAAARHGLKTVAFCCISTGIFAFPQQLAARIATSTVRGWLAGQTGVERVIFTVFTANDQLHYTALLP